MTRSQRIGIFSFVGILLAVSTTAIVMWQQDEEKKIAEARAREAQVQREREQEEERMRRSLDTVTRAQEESSALMPEPLRGVSIGMQQSELMALRRGINARTHENDGYVWMEETLSNGAQVLYGFEPRARRLLQVQVLSTIARREDFATHIQGMNSAYGTPTGAWGCEDDGIPMRRFTWRRQLISVMDVFLVYGNRASLTLYIAPNEIVAQSLEKGHCASVSGPGVAEFPQVPASKLAGLVGGQDQRPSRVGQQDVTFELPAGATVRATP